MKETLEMAREAGLQEHIVFSKALEAFAELVREDEREACANLVFYSPPAGDIRALKHRIHELEGELLGYKKIVAEQDAISANKEALAAIPPQRTWVGLKDDEIMEEPIGYLCENATGHRYFRWKKPPSVYNPIALYAKP